MKRKIWFVSVVMLLSQTGWTSDKSAVRFGANVRLLNSPGYHDFLDDAYMDVSGGTGWIGGDVGVLFRLADHLALEPKVEGYYNSLKVSSFGGSSTQSNVMCVPALALRYFLYEHNAIEIGVSGQVGMPLISTQLENISMTGDGPGFALAGGFRVKKSLDIQVGYSYYPIRVSSSQPFATPNLFSPKTYNFGGPFLSVGYYF